MSPHAKDMTDRQRRWWFAQLDEEKSSQGSRNEPSPRSTYLTESQRRRIEVRKEFVLGRMHGWALVSGKTVQYQPRDTLEHHYEQGFKEGVTEAKEWVTGMTGIAEMLGEIVRKVWDALRKVDPFREIPKPWEIDLFPPLPGTITTPRQRDKAVRSLKKLVKEHEQKLADYMRNFYAHDNKGHLRNAAGMPERQSKIYESRIRGLKEEIAGYKKRIIDLEKGR